MAKSNFNFLAEEYPSIAKLGLLAEQSLYKDPSNTLSKLRIILEKVTQFIIKYEGLSDYSDKQFDRLRVLQQELDTPQDMLDIFHTVRKSGNNASHEGEGTSAEARFMMRKAFHVLVWFYNVYEDEDIMPDFTVPQETEDVQVLVDNTAIKELEAKLLSITEELKSKEEKIKELAKLTEEQKQERKERSQKVAKKRSEESEAETRDKIDQQLRDAGWICDTKTYNYKSNKTLPRKGKNIAIAEWKCATKWADYALFIGEELVGIVEAKKHIKDVSADLVQAKNYSKIVTEENGAVFVKHENSENYKVPFIFATNGRQYLEQYKTASGIWYWDGQHQNNIPKPLPAWFSPRDLKEKLNFSKKEGETKLKQTGYEVLQDPMGLNLRNYQIDAIKAVENKIINNQTEQRSLLAMATGTGKTRTILGLCYRLISSGRFKRILFLVDRTMLGNQAQDAFKEVKIEGMQTFAQIYDLQGLKSQLAELDTKIHFATVQSMVKRILDSDTPPSVGDYDCIVVDEAHRGYILDKDMDDEELFLRDQLDYQSKYRKVLDYFDAHRIGLTATPALHTAQIFGEPAYTYSYRRAVVDGYLIDFEPPVVFETKLSQEGIKWEKGDPVHVYDPEDNEIKDAGVTEDEIKIEIQGFNKRVINDSFNRTILRALIEDYNLLPENQDKTLIFAATDAHADMIVQILKEELDELGADVDADAIVKITGSVNNREDLLRRFKNEQYPSIVVTVDLLTTGIDVPSISNLVFLRRVNSRILYDQMLGRATRRCDEIGKEVFKIYDCVGVTEIMAKEDVMKPIAPKISKTFVDLSEEINHIEEEVKVQIKVDRIIAKLQRKLRSFSEDQMERFEQLSGEKSASDFGYLLKSQNENEIQTFITDNQELWEYLDAQKGKSKAYGTLFSHHQDEVADIHHAYDENLKPSDYLESFNQYIKNNRNDIAALNIVCTKPNELTRETLKELKFILDAKGFNKVKLNTAYKDVTNKEIVADIIAHIRTAALGTELISHQDRIKNAISKLKDSRSFNAIQAKWLDKIEAQLIKENIVKMEDLNKPPFSMDGGIKRLDKIFKNETQEIIEELNEYLYLQA